MWVLVKASAFYFQMVNHVLNKLDLKCWKFLFHLKSKFFDYENEASSKLLQFYLNIFSIGVVKPNLTLRCLRILCCQSYDDIFIWILSKLHLTQHELKLILNFPTNLFIYSNLTLFASLLLMGPDHGLSLYPCVQWRYSLEYATVLRVRPFGWTFEFCFLRFIKIPCIVLDKYKGQITYRPH
jgi:hypothetical protein